jgi:predicted RNase H-like HicB family nuclease
MKLTIKAEKRPEGGWIAEVRELAWVVGHGVTREVAICRAEQLAVEEIAERIVAGELSEAALDLAFAVDSTRTAA